MHFDGFVFTVFSCGCDVCAFAHVVDVVRVVGGVVVADTCGDADVVLGMASRCRRIFC